jgi:hypothetical protein
MFYDDRHDEDLDPEEEGTWEDRETDAQGQCFSDAQDGF